MYLSFGLTASAVMMLHLVSGMGVNPEIPASWEGRVTEVGVKLTLEQFWNEPNIKINAVKPRIDLIDLLITFPC